MNWEKFKKTPIVDLWRSSSRSYRIKLVLFGINYAAFVVVLITAFSYIDFDPFKEGTLLVRFSGAAIMLLLIMGVYLICLGVSRFLYKLFDL